MRNWVKSSDLLWIGVADSDSAHVDTSLNLEVAFVSPVNSPRVLDKPVWNIVLNSVSNSKDSMVHILSGVLAYLGGIDASLVVPEAVNYLKGNRHWSMLEEGFGKLDFITLGDVDRTTIDGEDIAPWVDSALFILCFVGIGRLGGDSSRLNGNILEGMGWETSFTSVIVKVASAVN